jgi:high frequency lysogenization protein
MKHTIRDRCIALAGVFQACALVQQIASRGSANSAIIESTLETLFRFDVSSSEDVYAGLANISMGLRTLREQLTSTRNDRDIEITRYVISLLILERGLSRNKRMLETITTRLKETEASLDYFSLSHDNIFARLGEIYKDTISTLGPRVMISGEQPYLDNEHNASKVRALLLAGIRSAVLWRQCGGSRWQILLGRKKYVIACDRLLAEI